MSGEADPGGIVFQRRHTMGPVTKPKRSPDFDVRLGGMNAVRRLTRLTNAFSKKLDNLKAAAALHFAHYNLCRVHGSLRVMPAMAAGLVSHLWEIGDLLPS